MITYEEMLNNKRIIDEMTRKFRKELTAMGAAMLEDTDVCEPKDYIRFMNDLTFEEFAVNYHVSLLVEPVIETYEEVIEGKKTIDEFAMDCLSEEVYNTYKELIG